MQAGSSTMLDYFFYLTNFTSSSPEEQAKVRKILYYKLLPYFRKQFKNSSIVQQIETEKLFPIAIVRHPFERYDIRTSKCLYTE